jgi:hypothetical protein
MNYPEGAISIREYARSLGVSDTAVRKAFKSGKIKNGIVYPPKGEPYVFPDIASTEWGKNFNPQKGGDNLHVIENLEKKTEKKISEKPEPKRQNKKEEVPLSDEEINSNPELDENTSIGQALRIQAIYKAKMLKLEYQEQELSLVDKKEIDRKLFDLGKELRVGLENIPAQIVDNVMAATNRNEALIIMKTAIQEGLFKIGERLKNGL